MLTTGAHRVTRSRKAVALAVIAALTFAACGGDDDDDSASSTTTDEAAPGDTDVPEATEPTGSGGSTTPGEPTTVPAGAGTPGGVLQIAIGTDPISLNPTGRTAGRDAWAVIRQVVDSLVAQDPATSEVVPWLAESWEISSDATEFTFTLRDDVTFSDGTPLTADVVKANFDDIVANSDKIKPDLQVGMATFTGAAVVDEHTITIAFSAPNAPFLQSASLIDYGIVSQATLDLPYDDRFDQIIGTGPFTIVDYTPNSSIELTRRDDYQWAPEFTGTAGPAYLDGLTFQVIPEPSVRTGTLQQGDLDAITGVLPADIGVLNGGGTTIVSRTTPGVVLGLLPIHKRPLIADAAVRQAIAQGIDKQEVVDTVLTPEFQVATSVISSTTPGYVDLADLAAYDPEAAQAALDAAGWTLGADGIREKDGEPLHVVVAWFPNFSSTGPILELVQSQLRQIGIDLEVQQKTGQEIVQALTDNTIDYFWLSYARAEADVLKGVFTLADPNFYGRTDEALETLLQEQAGIADPAARQEVVEQIQRNLLETWDFAPVAEDVSVFATGENVRGFLLGADSNIGPLVGTWIEQ